MCLVNIGLGTPFISWLDLRPLGAAMYPEATLKQSLLLLNLRRPGAKYALNRYHFWRPATSYGVFRSPSLSNNALFERQNSQKSHQYVRRSYTHLLILSHQQVPV